MDMDWKSISVQTSTNAVSTKEVATRSAQTNQEVINASARRDSDCKLQITEHAQI
jgi:hypothetical protein